MSLADKQTQEVYRTCSHCGYVNSLDNKYCEKSGCNSPLPQLAHDEIKAAEQAKLQELVNKSNTEHEERITKLQHDLESMKKDIQDVKEFKRIKSKNPRYGYEEFREEID